MEIKDWYKEVKNTGVKDKSYKNHEIEPNSIIGLIGQSGSGKSTALIDFHFKVSRKVYGNASLFREWISKHGTAL